jgi:hypothetical protein
MSLSSRAEEHENVDPKHARGQVPPLGARDSFLPLNRSDAISAMHHANKDR